MSNLGSNTSRPPHYRKSSTLHQCPLPNRQDLTMKSRKVIVPAHYGRAVLTSLSCSPELNNRAAFIDFCKGLLDLNPITRWTPQQARLHPFITGEKFTKPFVVRIFPFPFLTLPLLITVTQPEGLVPPPSSSTSTSTAADPKRPYGGLVPAQSKGARAYPDAATYNHHLAQHQAYTAQQASQAANTFRNPYMNQQNVQQQQQQPPASNSYSSAPVTDPYQPAQNQTQAQQLAAQYGAAVPGPPHRALSHQNSTGQLGTGNAVTSQYPTHSAGSNLGATSLAPGNYYPNSRGRANTINQMDTIPPALARLQHMNQDIIGGRNALTPVLNRDDAMREWERRQSGKPPAAQPYPQLEYLQQQAEMVAASGLTNWNSAQHSRYPAGPSKLAHSYQPMIVDDENTSASANANVRRDAVMQNVRAAARTDGASGLYGGGSAASMISSPPQAYTATGPPPTSSAGGGRYGTGFAQQATSASTAAGGSGSGAFDSVDRRTDIGPMFVPMGDQYQGYSVNTSAATGNRLPTNAGPGQQVQPSFYGPGVVPSGTQQQRNPFTMGTDSQPKDARWQR
jgi:dual specificity protein kinase YAK1